MLASANIDNYNIIFFYPRVNSLNIKNYEFFVNIYSMRTLSAKTVVMLSQGLCLINLGKM